MTESLTMAAASAALKIKWPTNKLVQEFYEESPTAKQIPIDLFSGQDDMRLPIQYAMSAGRSAVLSTAIANMAATEQTVFKLTTSKDYGAFKIDSEAILAGMSPEALVDLLDNQTKSIIANLRRSFANDIFRDGSGECGRVGSIPGAGSFILKNPEDVCNFEINKKFKATANKSAERVGVGTVTNVDRDTGTITYSGTITSFAADDFVYAEGDFNAKLKGFDAWNPVTAPGSTAFFGVDRSVDVVRLSGWRFAADGSTALEVVEKALTRASRHGSQPDRMVCGSDFASQIRRNIGDRMRVTKMESPSTKVVLDIESFSVGGRSVVLVEDFQCPAGVVRFWKNGTVKVYARKKQIPMILNADGNDIRAHATDDAYVGRIGYYAQMGCDSPLHLGVLSGV